MHNEHHHDHEHEHEHAHIYLTLEDDTELECHVIGTFEVDDVEYIALTPVDGEKGEIYLYRYVEDEDGIDLQNIEDDEEFDVVSEAFYELFKDELDLYDEEYEDYDEVLDELEELDEDYEEEHEE